jgi:hypothetical protein
MNEKASFFTVHFPICLSNSVGLFHLKAVVAALRRRPASKARPHHGDRAP